jgi:hypothetical protein
MSDLAVAALTETAATTVDDTAMADIRAKKDFDLRSNLRSRVPPRLYFQGHTSATMMPVIRLANCLRWRSCRVRGSSSAPTKELFRPASIPAAIILETGICVCTMNQETAQPGT